MTSRSSVPRVFSETFQLDDRQRRRLLASFWRSVYEADFDQVVPDGDLGDIRAWCRDTDPDGFVELLRVAYQHGKAAGVASDNA